MRSEFAHHIFNSFFSGGRECACSRSRSLPKLTNIWCLYHYMMKIYTRRWTSGRRRHLMALASFESRNRRKSDRAPSFPQLLSMPSLSFITRFVVSIPPLFRRTVFLRTTPLCKVACRLLLARHCSAFQKYPSQRHRKALEPLPHHVWRMARGCKKKLMWYNAIREREWLLATLFPNVPRIWRSVQVHLVDGNLLSTNPQVVSLLRRFYELKILLMQMNFWLKTVLFLSICSRMAPPLDYKKLF